MGTTMSCLKHTIFNYNCGIYSCMIKILSCFIPVCVLNFILFCGPIVVGPFVVVVAVAFDLFVGVAFVDIVEVARQLIAWSRLKVDYFVVLCYPLDSCL